MPAIAAVARRRWHRRIPCEFSRHVPSHAPAMSCRGAASRLGVRVLHPRLCWPCRRRCGIGGRSSHRRRCGTMACRQARRRGGSRGRRAGSGRGFLHQLGCQRGRRPQGSAISLLGRGAGGIGDLIGTVLAVRTGKLRGGPKVSVKGPQCHVNGLP